MRQRGGRDDRRIGDLHLVVHLVALLQAAQDRDGVLHRGFIDQHLLEPALQRRVLFDVGAVFVERRRAHAMQLPARQCWLEHVAGVHRAIGLAGADHRVQLVDEQDDLSFLFGQVVQHALEPLLEVAAVLGAGDQRAHIQREDPLAAQSFRHFAVDDAQRESFDDRGLAHAGLADQHRVILGAPLQYLDGASDLVVAADHRIELALLGALGQVDRVFLERPAGLLGIGVIDLLALAHLLDGLLDTGAGRAGILDRLRELALAFGCREHEQLRGDVAVAAVLRELVGQVEQP